MVKDVSLTLKSMPNVEEIKYIKTEDVSVPKDFSSSVMFVMFAHHILHTNFLV